MHKGVGTLQTDNLSKYIISTASKYLSAVDISNYKLSLNEFDEVSNIHLILGNEKLLDVPAKFLYLTDDDYEDLFDIGSISWYDASENSTPYSGKFRLFYSENMAMYKADEGDLLVIAIRQSLKQALKTDCYGFLEQQNVPLM